MTENSRKRYSKEIKEAIVKRMMPPSNEAISQLSEETGITEATLYKWRKQARAAGHATPGDGQGSEQWRSEDKFLIVMETYAMNQAELAEYCRKKGLYKEQIEAWRDTCLNANGSESSQKKQLNQELKELHKKEKALAEAAALLLLRNKAQAIWGDQEDE